ncbi:MAG: MBL fold metallo-hydrolase [Butyrivibrio sp.]|nr:MBL fold metallo-hydrolase [Butyrivibrio sp.]
MRSKQFIIGIIVMMLLIMPVLGGCGRQTVAEPATEVTGDVIDAQSTGSDSSLTITALKGGAADSFVLISENHVVVIDTGLESKADKLVEFLKSQGVSRIDELIITHFDKDHVGGADHIISEFEVGTVYATYHSKESDDVTEYLAALESAGLSETTVTQELSFEADNVIYTIYPPQQTSYADSESNNSSLVVRVNVGENSMLFAGDAEAARINELLETAGLESTILKVPHHGRLDANTEELIAYINPDYAIITSSNSEPEDQEVLDMLAAGGVQTYLTRDGNVTIVMDDVGITVTQ